jgi:hypothetical protein
MPANNAYNDSNNDNDNNNGRYRPRRIVVAVVGADGRVQP